MSDIQNKLDEVQVLTTLKVNNLNQSIVEKLINDRYIDGYLIPFFNGVTNEIFAVNLKGLTEKGEKYLMRLKGEIKLLSAGIELA